ncbi:MAG: AraC family transcriptional regulator [Thermodesulfobacteriota bacterium]
MTNEQEKDRKWGHSDRSRSLGPARFFFWPGCALLLGTVDDASPHSHHALQVAIAINGTFVLETPTKRCECGSAVIAPNQLHRFLGGGKQQLIILLDAESAVAQRIQSAMCEASPVGEFDIKILEPFIDDLSASFGELPDCRAMGDLSQRILSALARGVSMPRTSDPRIQSALDFMKRQPELRARLEVVAEAVALSEGRLVHLFREQVGIPMRRYLLWLRLIRAIDNLFDHVSLTTAAHNAGFADSAHFTRTFRRMFGITPSALFKNSQFVQVIACPD